MGKKPVVAMFGLVWVGMALTGCGKCCQKCTDCQPKYNASPTYSRNASAATPAVAEGKATGSSNSPAGLGAAPEQNITPVSGTNPAATSSNAAPAGSLPVSSPASQTNLRPSTVENASTGALPVSRSSERPGEIGTPGAAAAAADRDMPESGRPVMPPLPVTNKPAPTPPGLENDISMPPAPVPTPDALPVSKAAPSAPMPSGITPDALPPVKESTEKAIDKVSSSLPPLPNTTVGSPVPPSGKDAGTSLPSIPPASDKDLPAAPAGGQTLPSAPPYLK